jgi:transmembrane sensor
MRDTDKNVVPFPDAAAIEAEAAEWAVRFDGGEVTAENYAKFQEWQSRSAYHRDAAARLFRLWGDLDALKTLATPIAAIPPKPTFWRRAHLPYVVAAAASVVLMLASFPTYMALHTEPLVVMTYQTVVGAQKTIALADGSTLTLNTNTAVRVVLSDKRRDVHLLRGEAYFEVAHDDKRPFAVFAGQGVVRDIGTAFDVTLLPQAVDVTVVHGHVELAALNGDAGQFTEQHLAVVAAGQNAVFTHKVRRLSAVSGAAINRRLAWRQGVLVYAGEPLAQVVADYNRYSNVKVEIVDPKLNDLQVGGYFEIGKSEAFLEALNDNFGIRVQWRDAHHAELFAAKSEAGRPAHVQ